MSDVWPVPFVISPQNLAVDSVVAFCVSVLLAVMVNAEAQAFAATFLGDSQPEAKDRFHFNAFLHLSLLGSICYLVAGFGWSRTIAVDAGKFKHPRIYLVITRFAGPVANLLLASIGGSIAMVSKSLDWNPEVFLMVVGVNVTTALYNLIILPPLAGGVLVAELIPVNAVRKLFYLAGPYLLLALALLDRLSPHGIVSPYLNPMIVAVFDYIRS